MSKVYSDEVKEVVYKKKRMITGVGCDICGKLIPPYEKWTHNEDSLYFDVMTGHHDWGNDSCESIEHRDICPDCIDKFVSDYLRDCSDTGYLEIEKEFVSPNDYEWE